jgi:Glycosyl hydrolase family 12
MNVHSYPHIKFSPPILPIAIPKVTNMTLSAQWTMTNTDNVVANVAWDLFADPDPDTAGIDSQAHYEIMIWMAKYGGALPIGNQNGLCLDDPVKIGSLSLYVLSLFEALSSC